MIHVDVPIMTCHSAL